MYRFTSRTLMLLALALMLTLSGAFGTLAAPAPQVAIEDVGADTPAEEAGLLAGDIILAFNGAYMTGVDQLAAAILASDPGDTVTLNILRDDEFLELTATLAARDGRAFLGIVPSRPADDGAAPTQEPTAEPTEEPAEEMQEDATATPAPEEEATPEETPVPQEESGEEEVGGALIAEVVPDSPAARAGIQPGDVITAVEGEPVNAENDLGTLITQYEPGDDVGIALLDPATGDKMTIVVTLGENPNDATLPFLGVRYMMPGMEPEALPQPTTPAPEEEVSPEATPIPEEERAPEATPVPEEEATPDVTPVAPEETLAIPTDLTGALVGAVLTGGPADEAGILPGDVITAVEDEAVTPENDLAALIAQYEPSDEVGITLIDPESGEEVIIVVVLGENPSDATLPFLGVRYIPIEAEETDEEATETDGTEADDAEADGAEADATPTPMAEEESAEAATDEMTDEMTGGDVTGDDEESDPTRSFRPTRPEASPEAEQESAPAMTPTPAPEEEETAAEATPEVTEEAEEEADGAAAPAPEDMLPGMHGMLSGALVGRVVADSPAAEAGIRTGDIVTAVDGVEVNAENDLGTLIGQYAPEDTVELTIVAWRQGERSVSVTLAENPDQPGRAFLGISYMPLDMEEKMPRGQRGLQDGSGPMAPFLRHHGMDMDEFMQHLGCDQDDPEAMPPYCELFEGMTE